MANCEFNGIHAVSGTLSKHVVVCNGEKITTSVVAKVINGKQKVYLRNYSRRAKPPTKSELQIRRRFAQASAFYHDLSDPIRRRYHAEWKKSGYLYRGKKYVTLRGYVIARFYAADLIDLNAAPNDQKRY